MKRYIISLLVVGASTAAIASNVVPYVETFEAYASGFEMAGTNGWSAAVSSDAVVSTDDNSVAVLNAYNGLAGYPGGTTNHTKVLEVAGTVTNSFDVDAGQTVWVDMMLQVGSVPPIDAGLLGSAQAAIYFNADGHPMIYHRDVVAGTNCWTEIPEVHKYGGAWARATIRLDDQTDYFQVNMDGNVFTNALAWTSNGSGSPGGSWFAMPGSANALTQLIVDGHGADLDDLVVTTINPLAATIESLAYFSEDIYQLVVNLPAGNKLVSSASYPIKSTDLVVGDWANAAHSTNGLAPFIVTNLDYSATLGSSKVIYLEATEDNAFFGFGDE